MMDAISVSHLFFNTLFMLLVGHALADFALQNDYVANAKNPNTKQEAGVWVIVMAAHSLIHAGMVILFTGYTLLGVLEFFAHFWIDYRKCNRKLTYIQDQQLHVLCKIIWTGIAVILGGVTFSWS